jgi:hypothetical protein
VAISRSSRKLPSNSQSAARASLRSPVDTRDEPTRKASRSGWKVGALAIVAILPFAYSDYVYADDEHGSQVLGRLNRAIDKWLPLPPLSWIAVLRKPAFESAQVSVRPLQPESTWHEATG